MQALGVLFFATAVFLVFLFYGSPPAEVLLSLRLPEALLSFFFGGVLALSGGVFQNSLRNPLAEPYVLGVASGSSFGSCLGVLFGFSPLLGALSGGFFSLLLLLFGFKLFRDSLSILLFGVALNALFSALILFTYALLPAYTLQDALYYTLGFIQPLTIKETLFLGLVSLVWLLLSLFLWKPLSLLPLGSELAYFCGVEPERERVKLLFLFTVPVSLFVSYLGVIGFLGLVVPHGVRFLGYRVGLNFLLLTYVAGGAALLLSQLLARSLLYPTLLPAGVVTAILGAPAFLLILWRYSYGAKG